MALLCIVKWLGLSIFNTLYNKFILTVNFLQCNIMELSLFPLLVHIFVCARQAMTRVRVTITAVEKQYVLNIKRVCLHSCLSYLACSVRAPYCIVIFDLPGCIVFFSPRFSENIYFAKKKVCFLFTLQFCVKHFEL
jgi:hypothetical protein